MSYRFERDDSVAEAVPRIAKKQARTALQALARHRDSAERVHEARTSVKKLRALLRLVAPALGDARYDRENDRLRDLADSLSKLRDAEVMIETFDGLFDRFEEQLGPPLRRVRTRLKTRLRGVKSRIDLPGRLRDATRALEKTRKRARRWVPRKATKADGWKAIVGGLGATYRWARQALAAAYDGGGDEDFHEWRKSVKYHGYHIRLLADVWPEELNGRLEVLEHLGDLLGEDHDLAVFAETLKSEPRCFDNKQDQQVLRGLIDQRQQALRAMARPLGRRLFAEPPAAFCRRLRSYWQIWRDREEQQVVAAAAA